MFFVFFLFLQNKVMRFRTTGVQQIQGIYIYTLLIGYFFVHTLGIDDGAKLLSHVPFFVTP